jgi:hypothetical protein
VPFELNSIAGSRRRCDANADYPTRMRCLIQRSEHGLHHAMFFRLDSVRRGLAALAEIARAAPRLF